MRTYRCFGIAIASPLAFPGAWATAGPADDPTTLIAGALGPWGGSPGDGWQGVCDGERFAAERGIDGTHRFFHGGRTLLELSGDGRRLTGDLDPAVTDVHWWRTVLDSVLFTVGLLRGGEALHAGAVVTPSGAVAIAGPSGSGKSTVLAHLVARRGLQLLSDDVLFVDATGDAVLAHPGPPLMTVPRALPNPPGTEIAKLGDETWRVVATVRGPVPLRRIVLLDRSGGPDVELLPEPDPFRALMRGLLPFPRDTDRSAARLALASALCRRVELVRLRGALDCPVEQVAACALDSLTGAPA